MKLPTPFIQCFPRIVILVSFLATQNSIFPIISRAHNSSIAYPFVQKIPAGIDHTLNTTCIKSCNASFACLQKNTCRNWSHFEHNLHKNL